MTRKGPFPRAACVLCLCALAGSLLAACGRELAESVAPPPAGVPSKTAASAPATSSASVAPGEATRAAPSASSPTRGLEPSAPRAAATAASDETAPALPALHGGGARVVASRRGMVVSVEAHATRAGVEILEQGGNAVDAAVAVAFALAVTHPNAGNLGGGGFLVHQPRGGPAHVVDFREKAAAGVTKERFDRMIAAGARGPEAVAVPGTVAGLNLALARYGTLPRARVIEPALRLARDGFPLGEYQARTVKWAFADLARDRRAARVFGKGGRPLPAGARLVQPELARTLERILGSGDDGFYRGETAKEIAALGGPVTEADLAEYQAVIREPFDVPYRGLTVVLPPPPSAGAVAVAVELRLLERAGAQALAPLAGPEAHLFAEIARRAHAVRRFEVGDPDTLPAFDWAAARAAWLDVDRLLAASPAVDPDHATPSARVSPLYEAAQRELEHTTHLSVVDAAGNAVSLTTTLSASFGARVMAAGVVLNNSLAAFGTVGANVLAPRRRMTASMAPAIVLSRGEPVLVLGSPGGDTIPNTVVRVLRNVVDYGMTLDLAVEAPRLHHGFVPDEVRYESSRPPPRATLAALRKRGHRLAAPSRVIGDANCILLEGGTAYGYADPREGGTALAPREPTERSARLPSP